MASDAIIFRKAGHEVLRCKPRADGTFDIELGPGWSQTAAAKEFIAVVHRLMEEARKHREDDGDKADDRKNE